MNKPLGDALSSTPTGASDRLYEAVTATCSESSGQGPDYLFLFPELARPGELFPLTQDLMDHYLLAVSTFNGQTFRFYPSSESWAALCSAPELNPNTRLTISEPGLVYLNPNRLNPNLSALTLQDLNDFGFTLDAQGLIAETYWTRAGIEADLIGDKLSDGESWLHLGLFVGSAYVLVALAGPIGWGITLAVGGYSLYTGLEPAADEYVQQKVFLEDEERLRRLHLNTDANIAFLEAMHRADGIATMVDAGAKMLVATTVMGTAQGALSRQVVTIETSQTGIRAGLADATLRPPLNDIATSEAWGIEVVVRSDDVALARPLNFTREEPLAPAIGDTGPTGWMTNWPKLRPTDDIVPGASWENGPPLLSPQVLWTNPAFAGRPLPEPQAPMVPDLAPVTLFESSSNGAQAAGLDGLAPVTSSRPVLIPMEIGPDSLPASPPPPPPPPFGAGATAIGLASPAPLPVTLNSPAPLPLWIPPPFVPTTDEKEDRIVLPSAEPPLKMELPQGVDKIRVEEPDTALDFLLPSVTGAEPIQDPDEGKAQEPVQARTLQETLEAIKQKNPDIARACLDAISSEESSDLFLLLERLLQADSDTRDNLRIDIEALLAARTPDGDTVADDFVDTARRMTYAERQPWSTYPIDEFWQIFGSSFGDRFFNALFNKAYEALSQTHKALTRLEEIGNEIGIPLSEALERLKKEGTPAALENFLTLLESVDPKKLHALRAYLDSGSPESDRVIKNIVRVARPLQQDREALREKYALAGVEHLRQLVGDRAAQQLFNALVPEGLTVLHNGKLIGHWWTTPDKVKDLGVNFYGEFGDKRTVALKRDRYGNFVAVIEGVPAGTYYKLLVTHPDPAIPPFEIPDPFSAWQPEGVHSASRIFNPQHFDWGLNRPQDRKITEAKIVELPIGTATPEGTLQALMTGNGRALLQRYKDQGFNAIELMPFNEFPGTVNPGYDGVNWKAVSHAYGTPADLQAFVKMCHEMGLAVYFDVVFNHLGPEGNYFDVLATRSSVYGTDAGGQLAFNTNTYDNPGQTEVDRWFLYQQNMDLLANVVAFLNQFNPDGYRLDLASLIGDPGGYNGENRAANARALRLIYDVARQDNPHALVILEDGRVDTEKQELFEGAFGDLIDRARHVDDVGVSYWAFGFQHILATLMGAHNSYPDQRIVVGDLGFAMQYGVRDGKDLDPKRMPSGVLTFAQHDDVMNQGQGMRYIDSMKDDWARFLMGLVIPALSRGAYMVFAGDSEGDAHPYLFVRDLEGESSPLRHGDTAVLNLLGWFPQAERDPQTGAFIFRDPQAKREAMQQARQKMALSPEVTDPRVQRLIQDVLRLRDSSAALRSPDVTLTNIVYEHNDDGLLILMRKASDEPDAEAVMIVINLSDRDYTQAGHEFLLETKETGTWNVVLNTLAPEYGGSHSLAGQTLETGRGATRFLIPPASVTVYKRESGTAADTNGDWVDNLKQFLAF